MLTLKDFSERILKPNLVQGIRSGRLDATFADPYCLIIMICDIELRKALLERLADIENMDSEIANG